VFLSLCLCRNHLSYFKWREGGREGGSEGGVESIRKYTFYNNFEGVGERERERERES